MTVTPVWTRRLPTRREVLWALARIGVSGAMSSVLVSCEQPGAPPQAAPTQSTERGGSVTTSTTQAVRDGGTLRAFFGTQDPPTLDPYVNTSFRGQTFAAFVYSRLLMSKKAPGVAANAYIMEGDLASSWQHSDDGLTYTFKLRPNASWHNIPPMNGRLLTAADVTWSFEHFMQVSPQRSTFDVVADVSAPDDHTLVFRLKSVYAPFEALVGAPIFWILPPEVVQQDGDVSKRPIGSGPFIFDTFDPGVSISVRKNPNYYRSGEPHVDRVLLNIIPDNATQVAAMRAGQLDFLPIDQQNVDSLRASNPELQVVESEALQWPYVYWSIDRPPFNDVRVRQAVSMALDRDNTIKIICAGRGNWNNAVPWAMTEWWLDPRAADMGPNAKFFNYDLAAAKQLLTDAGYPNGFRAELLSTAGYGDVFVQAVELVQHDLAALGIDATIHMQDYADYVSTTFQGKFEGANQLAFGILSPPSEPYLHLSNLFSPRGARNSAGVNDPPLATTIEQLRQVFDIEQRKKLVFDIQRSVAEKAYYVPYVAGMTTAALSPRVRNFFANSDFGFGAEVAPKLWLDS